MRGSPCRPCHLSGMTIFPPKREFEFLRDLATMATQSRRLGLHILKRQNICAFLKSHNKMKKKIIDLYLASWRPSRELACKLLNMEEPKVRKSFACYVRIRHLPCPLPWSGRRASLAASPTSQHVCSSQNAIRCSIPLCADFPSPPSSAIYVPLRI